MAKLFNEYKKHREGSEDTEPSSTSSLYEKYKNRNKIASVAPEVDFATDYLSKATDSDMLAKYASVMQNADFAENSQYKGGSGFHLTNQVAHGAYENLNSGNNKDPRNFSWTPNEKAVFNYLYNTEDYKTATQLLLDLTKESNVRYNEIEKAEAQKRIDNYGNLVGESALSIPKSVVGGFGQIVGGLSMGLASALQGEGFSKGWTEAAEMNRLSNAANAVREASTEKIAQDSGNKVAPFLYQTGMSVGDSLFSALISGGVGELGALLALGGSASQQKTMEVLNNGGTAQEAAMSGITSGVIEGLTEKVSLGHLTKILKGDAVKGGFRELAKRLAKNMLEEAGEEATSELANALTDAIILDWTNNIGTESDLKKFYDEQIANGDSEAIATEKTIGELVKNTLASSAGGAVGALMSGGVTTGIRTASDYRAGKTTNKYGRTQDIADLARKEGREDIAQMIERNPSNLNVGYAQDALAEEAIETLRDKKAPFEDKIKGIERLTELNKKSSPITGIADKKGKMLHPTAIKWEEGSPVFVTEEGTYKAADVTVTDSASKLINLTEDIPEQARQTFIENYNGENLGDYVNKFEQAYELAKADWQDDLTKMVTDGLLTEAQMKNIYAAAQKDVTSESYQLENLKKNIEEKKKLYPDKKIRAKIDTSAVDLTKLNANQRHNVTLAETLAKALGFNLTLFDSTKETGKRAHINGSYEASTNTIALDINAKNSGTHNKGTVNAIITTLSHEITHWSKTNAPGIYKAFRDTTLKTLNKNSDRNLATIGEYVDLNKIKYPGLSDVEVADELVARGCENMLQNSEFAKEALGRMTAEEEKTLKEKIIELFDKILEAIKEIMGRSDSNSLEYRMLKKDADRLAELQKMWDSLIREAASNSAWANMDTAENNESNFRITKGMSDTERYELLKNRTLSLSAQADIKALSESEEYDHIDDRNLKYNERVKLLKTLGEQFGIFKEYSNKDIKLSFEYSKSNLKESTSKQSGEKRQLAKLLSCLDEVVSNAIGIEVHNRNEEEYKKNENLKNVYVLVSAFEDQGKIIPVKLEVKEFETVSNSLYLSVALEGIEKDEVVTAKVPNEGDSRSAISSTIRLAELFRKINKKDVNFLKYVPKQFFETSENADKMSVDNLKGAKFSAKEDSEYEQLVKSNPDEARKMLDVAAKQWGAFKADPDAYMGKDKMIFFHGTYSDNFTLFDKSLTGTGSGDSGFFGRGFYFAYTKGEARTYGNNVMQAYLKMQKPFDFTKELYSYDGSEDYNDARDSIFISNFVKRFPELAKDKSNDFYVRINGDQKKISLTEYAKMFDEAYKNLKFTYSNYFDEYENRMVYNVSVNDPNVKYPLKVLSTVDEAQSKNRTVLTEKYLKKYAFEWMDLPSPKEIVMSNDFSDAVKALGYDGIIQSKYGDEAVVFDENQIKSADLLTYDDKGNVIPLSERFTENPDIRYSQKEDSEGNVLSEGQADYFADSKIRDKKGNLILVYHGTPRGGFTVFRNGLTYFTANKKYAERYTRTSGSGRTGDTSQIYSGYINITTPFTLDDKEAKRIYIEEFIKGGYAQGMNPYASDAEIQKYASDGIDWNEADNLKDFFDEMGYDYDGIILNEGGDITENGTVMRGDSYVTFNQNQFKDKNNLNPTKDKDIRYSIKDTVTDVNGEVYHNVIDVDDENTKNIISNTPDFRKFVHSLAGHKIVVYDERGNKEIIEFAEEGEEVKKVDKKKHDVLDEFEYIKGSLNRSVVVNIDDAVKVSIIKGYQSDSDHDWVGKPGRMDEYGWEHRYCYLLSDGKIYTAFLKIAFSNDGRNILYAVTVNAKKSVDALLGASSEEEGKNLSTLSSEEKITLNAEKVNKEKINNGSSEVFSEKEGMGNGYFGYSMSNNALMAYENGEKPISKWSKSEILEAIQNINPSIYEEASKLDTKSLRDMALVKTSWHHTSKMYNKTNFYSIDEDGIQRLTAADVPKYKSEKIPDKTYRGDITFLEWSGTQKHPKADKKTLEDVNILEKGSFYYIYDDDGRLILKKKIGSNGTNVVNYDEVRRREAAKAERERKYRENSTPEAYAYAQELLSSPWHETSWSGNIYPEGRKPSSYDYDRGLEKFFKEGERIIQDTGDKYVLKTWNGKEWVEQPSEVFSYKDNDGYLHLETDDVLSMDDFEDYLNRVIGRNKRIEAHLRRLNVKIKDNVILNQTKLHEFAKIIKDRYGLTGTYKSIEEELSKAYMKVTDIEGFNKAAESVAEKLIEESRHQDIDPAMIREVEALKKELRNYRISLNDVQKQELAYTYGPNWSSHLLGKVRLASDGIKLDELWDTLVSEHPDYFNTITDADEGANLAALLDRLYSGDYNGVRWTKEMTKERTEWLINDIREASWRISDNLTMAEKYDEAMKELRERLKNAKEEVREDAQRKRLITKIVEREDKLITMLRKNDKENHIPDVLKAPLKALLDLVDVQAYVTTEAMANNFNALANALQNVSADYADPETMDNALKDLTLYFDSNGYFVQNVKDIAAEVQSRVGNALGTTKHNSSILDLSMDSLKKLNEALVAISHAAWNYDKVLAEDTTQRISTRSKSTMTFLGQFVNRKAMSDVMKRVISFLAWDNTTPIYGYDRFGNGGKETFRGIMKGDDQLTLNSKVIIDFTKSVFTGQEAEDWSKEYHPLGIGDYKITTAQIMSLYCLNKRQAAKQHLYAAKDLYGKQLEGAVKNVYGEVIDGQGIVIGATKGNEKTVPIKVTKSDVERITSMLTDRQIEVADKLQEFMGTVCADWGNYVTMRRFGIMQFGEDNYFPMQVFRENSPSLPQETVQQASIFKLLNMGFTKSLNERGNGALELNSIFDVFIKHSSEMAAYNAFALPILDAYKWLSYKEEGAEGIKSLKTASRLAYGDDGIRFVMNHLEDLNGTSNTSTSAEQIVKNVIRRYKTAATAANMRVVLMQPTSYLRAVNEIDSKYLRRAITLNPKALRETINEMNEKSPLAMKKNGLGAFDVNVSRTVAEQALQTENVKSAKGIFEKAMNISMIAASKADEITWATLYKAVQLETKEKHPELKGDAFDSYVNDRFRDICYRTQVFDSINARSNLMRKKDIGHQVLTAFGSEPTLSYSMLSNNVFLFTVEARNGQYQRAWNKYGKKIKHAFVAFMLSALAVSAVAAVPDWLRDDEDDKNFIETYFKNFGMNILGEATGLLPYFRDIYSVFIEGYDPSRPDEEIFKTAKQAKDAIVKAVEDGQITYRTVYQAAKLFSQSTGLPIGNLVRDFKALWNKTVGEVFGMNIK